MSKAILVIDMPDKCGDCQFCSHMYNDEYEEWYDWCFANEDVIIDTESKEKNCPLKQLPTRVKNLDLEVWNGRNGYMLAPKGLFDEIYNDKEDDDEGNW